MPYACTYVVPADEEIYRQVNREMGNDGSLHPDGLVVHLAVQCDAGLRHYQVWETKAAWERFRDGTVLPAVGRVLKAAGFDTLPPPPVEEELQVVGVDLGRPA